MSASSQEEVLEVSTRLRLLLPVNQKYVPKNAIGANGGETKNSQASCAWSRNVLPRTALPCAGIPPNLRVPIYPNTTCTPRFRCRTLNQNLMSELNARSQIYPNTNQETNMKLALFGFAAVAAAAFVTPTLAQTTISSPGYCAQLFPGASCKT